MPLYDYGCVHCGKVFSEFRKVAARDESPFCCTSKTSRRVAAPRVAVDYESYQSPATGKWITGRKQHLEELKRTGCRLLEPGETAGMRKKQQENEKRIDAEIESKVASLANHF